MSETAGKIILNPAVLDTLQFDVLGAGWLLQNSNKINLAEWEVPFLHRTI